MRFTHISLATGALTAMLMISGVCSAEEGELQLGLATPFLEYESMDAEIEFANTTTDLEASGLTWGLRHEVAGELGYGVTPNIVIGGLFQLGGTSSEEQIEDAPETESSEWGFFLGPKFDYMFLPGDKVQPFIGAVLGIAHAKETEGDVETSFTAFQIMGRAGVRAFVTNGFSIDPSLAIAYLTGSGEIDNDNLTADLSGSAFQVGVLVGVSGWLD